MSDSVATAAAKGPRCDPGRGQADFLPSFLPFFFQLRMAAAIARIRTIAADHFAQLLRHVRHRKPPRPVPQSDILETEAVKPGIGSFLFYDTFGFCVLAILIVFGDFLIF